MSVYLADLHVHTAASPDGRSSLKELVSAAKAAGLHAMAITDHDLCTEITENPEDFLLIPGCEISTKAGHITGLFLQRPIDFEVLGRLPSPEAAVEAIHAAGGLAVWAHPYQKRDAAPETLSFPIDAMETANARADLKVKDANKRAEFLANQRSLPSVGGSDAHDRAEVGNAYTQLTADELTVDKLREALASGQSRAVLQRNTSHLRKGLSQWAKARRKGGMKNLLRSAAYMGYCAMLDVLRK